MQRQYGQTVAIKTAASWLQSGHSVRLKLKTKNQSRKLITLRNNMMIAVFLVVFVYAQENNSFVKIKHDI